ncbi:hypothetical protein MMC22_005326 [Lobaria immixta]|nr:hypothetical protein [Lobaria immixta]
MDQQPTQLALLEWINSFANGGQVESPSSLNDGLKIWSILHDIDAEYFAGQLPQASSRAEEWSSRWQNLKQIHKYLFPYLTTQCQQNPPKEITEVDLHAIAMDDAANETMKVGFLLSKSTIMETRLIVDVACEAGSVGRDQLFNTGKIYSADDKPQHIYPDDSDAIQDQVPESSDDKTASPSTPYKDPELLFEEQLANVMTENDNHRREKEELQKELRDLHGRLARLQENNDTLQARLTRAEDQVGIANSTDPSKQEASIKHLTSTLRQQEEVIASHEAAQIEFDRVSKEMKLTIEKLASSSSKYQRLRDDFDVLKAEKDSLARKANTAERYKQKLQASQSLEEENSELREELNEVREQLKSAQSARKLVAGLEVENEEYKRTLPKIEQDRHELQIVKQHLELDNSTLARRCELAEEQHARDEERIASLSVELRSIDISRRSDTSENTGLDAELGEHAKEKAQMKARLSRLEAERQKLKITVENQESKVNKLQQFLNEANEKREADAKKHMETYGRNLYLESSLAAVQRGDPIEKDTPTDTNRATAQGEVKNPPVTALTGPQSDEERLEQQSMTSNPGRGESYEDLVVTLERIKAATAEESHGDLLTILERLKEATVDETTESGNETLSRNMVGMARKIIDGRERLARKEELITHQIAVIEELQDRLQQGDRVRDVIDQSSQEDLAGRKDENSTAKVSTPRVSSTTCAIHLEMLCTNIHSIFKAMSQQLLIDNLKRENKLIASMYHDLAGRLQMDNVVLQRRGEAPKSWINRQRKLVDHPMMAMSR